MSTTATTVLPPPIQTPGVCAFCEIELVGRHRENEGYYPPVNDDRPVCWDCWIQPIAEDGAAEEAAKLIAEGLMPEAYVGC
jgi:hypothetical protein